MAVAFTTNYPIADSQIHVWGADTPDRPWPKSPDYEVRKQGDAQFLPEEALSAMDDAGVSRAILVPPSWEGDYNDLGLAAAAKYPERFAVMGRLQRDPETAKRQLARLREDRGMLGLRLSVKYPENTRRLLDPCSDTWMWSLMQKHEIPVFMQPVGLLPQTAVLAEHFPDLRIIIDHMALRRSKGEAAFADVPDLLKLAKFPNVAVKTSTMPLYSTQEYPFKDTHPYIRQVYETFGPKRMFWGSDLTRLPRNCSYPQAISMFTEELPWLAEADKEWVMGRSLCEWLRWPLKT